MRNETFDHDHKYDGFEAVSLFYNKDEECLETYDGERINKWDYIKPIDWWLFTYRKEFMTVTNWDRGMFVNLHYPTDEEPNSIYESFYI